MKLGFLDLIQSQFTLGLTVPNLPGAMLQKLPDVPNSVLANMPKQVHDFLSFVSVEELQTSYDDTAVVYSGRCSFDGSGEADATPAFKSSNGSLLQVQDLGFQFRITIPRQRSARLQTAFGATGIPATDADFADLQSTLAIFDSFAGPSDYPNIDFRIELLFNTITLHLPADTFLPAMLNGDGWLVKDPNYTEVRIDLPKIALVVSQTNDDYNTTKVEFKGWGINGLDEGGDAAAGEMISMTPSLCLHSSGIVGFGLEKIILDLSSDFTPTEILEKIFGIGDDFTGLWIPSVRLFVAPAGLRGFAVDTWAQDMLIDFDQGLSGEFGIELLNGAASAKMEIQTLFYQGGELREPAIQGPDVVVAVPNDKLSTIRNSMVAVAADGRLQLRIRGGRPIYTIAVKWMAGVHTIQELKATNQIIIATPVAGNTNVNEWLLNEKLGKGPNTIYISVTDQRGNTYEELIQATVLEKGTSSFNLTTIFPPELTGVSAGGTNAVKLAASQPDNDAVFIVTTPSFTLVEVGNTVITRNSNGTYRIPCARDNNPVPFSVKWKDAALPLNQTPVFDAWLPIKNTIKSHGENIEYTYFGYDSPGGPGSVPNPNHHPIDSKEYFKAAAEYYLDNAQNLNNGELPVRERLTTFINNSAGRPIKVYGYASFEHHNDTEHLVYNDALSHRRASTLIAMLKLINDSLTPEYHHTIQAVGDYLNPLEHAKGDMVAKQEPSPQAQDKYYHVAVACYDALAAPNAEVTVTGNVRRPEDETTVFKTPIEQTPSPLPAERPELFRRVAVKVRFQRNKLVLAEIYGQLNFAKEAEVRTNYVQSSMNPNTAPNKAVLEGVSTKPGATGKPSEPEGVVDFRLAMVYNEATRKLTQTLSLGFDQDNLRTGLVQLDKFEPKELANTIASLLIFAPLLNTGVEAIQSAQTSADRAAAIALGAAEFTLAALLGVVAIEMDHVTLFGAELSFTESSPDIWIGNADSLDEIGVLFDYGVQFRVNLDIGVLTIKTREDDGHKALNPPFVRYKALGFKLADKNDGNGFQYVPIFDTSKGYELSLGDPGALEVRVGGNDIGDLLKILSARLAKENPLLFELDLALGINLGIITVDQIRVTAKIDSTKGTNVDIMVVPTKVGVNIPGALIGTGYLDIGREKNVKGNKVHGGFRGYVDLTLVPLKLRIAASLGIGPVSDGVRNATAFFLALEVELPVAIPLGGTGLGIFGFLGLFGMHYKRSEPVEEEGALPPALRWFDEKVKGNVIDISGWEANMDKWSFGLGVILGTMEGGFVFNMKGMFMLELPGPRILIFVKANMLFPKPGSVKNEGSASGGILAVIDLDFNIGRLTIGLIMQYEIEKILSLRIPVDAQFNFGDVSKWHVYIGSNKLPAEALILGIVRGYAYLMLSGDGIDDFPTPGQPKLLNGLSLAVGLGASIIFGDKEEGLYLEVAGDFKAGIGFSPLVIYGNLVLRGELHLWVVSISAWAGLTVIAQTAKKAGEDKSEFLTWIMGEACGKVSLLLFDVEGCVTVEIGSQKGEQPPLKLVKTMTLVSRSTALIQGQGVDRPIDGALGKAVEKDLTGGVETDQPIPVVSIDAILALDMIAAPDVEGATSFTEAISKAPNAKSLFLVDGSDANTKVRYKVKSIKLNNGFLEDTLPKPANWWLQENNKNAKDSAISLALLSWTPDPTPHAVQRSEDLTQNVLHKWGTVCNLPAPPASIFWTFNQKPLGYSTKGWKLHGAMWPDPPGTFRSSSPSKEVIVSEPAGLNIPLENKYRSLAKGTILEHAKVITTNNTLNFGSEQLHAGRVLQFPVEHVYVRTKEPATGTVPADLISYFKLEETERIIIECEPLAGGNILLAVEDATTGLQNIYFRTLDKKNNVLENRKATDFNYVKISAPGDLPLSWKNPKGPWMKDVDLVMLFAALNSNVANYSLYLINYQPENKPQRFSITAKPMQQTPGRKAVLLCAMELVAASELERFEFDKTIQVTKTEIVEKALEGEKPRALLIPDKPYELEIEYEYEIFRDYLPVAKDTVIQQFKFRTDANAPLRIDPWIIATTPQKDMGYHFSKDTVQIVFTDDSVIQLYRAYGHELRAKLQKANGNHPPQTKEEMLITDNLDLNKNMSKEATSIKTAFHHTLDEVTQRMPCIEKNGVYNKNTLFTLPIDLMRNTTYTLDLVSDKVIPLPDKEPATPLYRISFTTSRYESIHEMGKIIKGSYVTPRALTTKLASMKGICSDNQLQEELMAAGLDALEPATDPRIILLWAHVGNNVFTPDALIIDTPEAIWRTRPYPFCEEVEDDEGKFMTHWTTADVPELEIEPDAPHVLEIARNQTGTRTIIYLKADAMGGKMDLNLRQYQFVSDPALYGNSGNIRREQLLNITIPNLPPWVENE